MCPSIDNRKEVSFITFGGIITSLSGQKPSRIKSGNALLINGVETTALSVSRLTSSPGRRCGSTWPQRNYGRVQPRHWCTGRCLDNAPHGCSISTGVVGATAVHSTTSASRRFDDYTDGGKFGRGQTSSHEVAARRRAALQATPASPTGTRSSGSLRARHGTAACLQRPVSFQSMRKSRRRIDHRLIVSTSQPAAASQRPGPKK